MSVLPISGDVEGKKKNHEQCFVSGRSDQEAAFVSLNKGWKTSVVFSTELLSLMTDYLV